MKRIGLIVNPIAGMGGKVGLKGSDGLETIKKAIELGAVPEAPKRAEAALKRMVSLRDRIELIVYPGAMGQEEAEKCGFVPTVIGTIKGNKTTPEDTENAARQMMEMGVDLIIFAGGDGTARNIYNAVRDKIPVLGIPAGVKIHSAVYATSPENAGNLVYTYLQSNGRIRLREAEVMDIDEEAFRSNRVCARLYGYLKIPYERSLVQSAKAGSASMDEVSMDEIASDVVNSMEQDTLYVIGPGTTTRAIMEKLRLPNTLLGVDAVLGGKLVGSDLNEEQLLEILGNKKSKIVVTVIGGQGHIFGRGNQQISPNVIRMVGKENIIIVATENKLLGLSGKPLLIDTGDRALDEALSGYTKVVTGINKRVVYPIRN